MDVNEFNLISFANISKFCFGHVFKTLFLCLSVRCNNRSVTTEASELLFSVLSSEKFPFLTFTDEKCHSDP